MNSASCWLFVDQSVKLSHQSDGGVTLCLENSTTTLLSAILKPTGTTVKLLSPHLFIQSPSLLVQDTESDLSIPTGCRKHSSDRRGPPLPYPPLFSLDCRIPMCQYCHWWRHPILSKTQL